MRIPKIGDTVILGRHTRTSASEVPTDAVRLNWVSEMEKYVGTVGTVSRIGQDSYEEYVVDVKENSFSWRVRDLKEFEYKISWSKKDSRNFEGSPLTGV